MRIIDSDSPGNMPKLKKLFRKRERFAVNGILFSISEVSNRQIVAKAIGRFEENRIVAPSSILFGPDGKSIKK